jgi:hypothetical protein
LQFGFPHFLNSEITLPGKLSKEILGNAFAELFFGWDALDWVGNIFFVLYNG